MLSGSDIRPDPEKVAAVQYFSTPQSKKQVQSILGICNYYRRFIQNFSKMARYLTDLTKKHASFSWSEECDQAMFTLKSKLKNAPVLGQFDPSKQTKIHTDASIQFIYLLLSYIGVTETGKKAAKRCSLTKPPPPNGRSAGGKKSTQYFKDGKKQAVACRRKVLKFCVLFSR